MLLDKVDYPQNPPVLHEWIKEKSSTNPFTPPQVKYPSKFHLYVLF